MKLSWLNMLLSVEINHEIWQILIKKVLAFSALGIHRGIQK